MIRVFFTKENDYGYFGASNYSEEELSERDLKKLKLETPHPVIDWNKINPEITHAVWYAEALDEKREVYFANVHLDGSAHYCTDDEFEAIYQKPGIGYVLAVHRH